MKKLFILFLLLFTTDSVASGIATNAASAPCTNTTLETYSGNSNLAADWQPNEIQLRWYNNNTLMDVQSSANTCTYDGTLTIPSTAPTRTGYTFAGWQVRPEMDFTTLSYQTYGKTYSIDSPNNDSPYYPGVNCMDTYGWNARYWHDCSDSVYKDLQVGEMKVVSSNGNTIYGTGKCGAKAGNNNNDTWNNASSNWRATYNELESVNGEKQYCWCQLTGYKNGDTMYGPNKSLPWIFIMDIGTQDMCNGTCATFCSAKFLSYPGLRNAMLSITQ